MDKTPRKEAMESNESNFTPVFIAVALIFLTLSNVALKMSKIIITQ